MIVVVHLVADHGAGSAAQRDAGRLARPPPTGRPPVAIDGGNQPRLLLVVVPLPLPIQVNLVEGTQLGNVFTCQRDNHSFGGR